MWQPLTVLSGLASGYCERAAVISGGSVGGNVWPAVDPAATQEAQALAEGSRAAIVSRMAHTVAKGGITPNSSATNMFSAVDVTMLPPKSESWPYMRAFDLMLENLVKTTGGYVRVSAGAVTSYGTFNSLGSAASSYAAACGSSTPFVASGGGSYAYRMTVAWPNDWALHRKWMLDELRYTSGAIVIENAIADVTGSYAEGSLDTNLPTVAANTTYQDIELNATWTTYSVPPLYRGSLDSSLEYDSDYNGAALEIGTPLSATLNVQVEGVTEDDPPTITWRGEVSDRQSYRRLGMDTVGYLETASEIETTETVNLYLDQGSPMFVSYAEGTTPTVSLVSNTVTATNQVQMYKVLDGGRLNVNNGVAVQNVLVESGGLLNIANGGRIECCTVLTGGTVTGIKNINNLNIDGMYPIAHSGTDNAEDPDDRTLNKDIAALAGTQFSVIEHVESIFHTDTVWNGTSSFYVHSGGTLTLSATYAEMQCNVRDRSNMKLARIFIDNGGYVQVKGTPLLNQIYFDSNGNGTTSANQNVLGTTVYGGSTYYNWKQLDNNDVWQNYYTKIQAPENGATVYNSQFVAFSTVSEVGRYDSAPVRVNCNIVVLSGGTFAQGLVGEFGHGMFDTEYYGGEMFIAYPGSTISFENREKRDWGGNGYGDGFDATTELYLSDRSNLTTYRITEQQSTTPLSSMTIAGGRASGDVVHVFVTGFTGNPSVVTNYWGTIIDVTGATFANYAERTGIYDVGGNPTVQPYTFEPGGYNPDSPFAALRCYMFNPMGLVCYKKNQQNQDIPLVLGNNAITVTASDLYGLVCRNENTSVLYQKSSTAHAWTNTETPSGNFPATIYTEATIPVKGDAVYTTTSYNASTQVAGTTVRGLVYPIIKGSTITLQDSPKAAEFLAGYYGQSYAVKYRCAIADINIVVNGSNTVSHYTEFRVRQFYNDPGDNPPSTLT